MKKRYPFAPLLFVFFLSLFTGNWCLAQVGINTTGAAPAASAIIDASSTTKGLLIPRMTTPQRDSIAISCSCTPALGLQIFNITTGCQQVYNPFSSAWENMFCYSCIAGPAAPVATAATGVTSTQITANWAAVSGAASYQLDVSTANDFSSYVSGYTHLNVGNVLTYNIPGLSNSTSYYYRLKAVNNCGTSGNSDTISATTNAGFPVSGLVHYWKLDGNSNDPVGSANGSDANITYSTGNGKINSGAGMNGTSSNISMGNLLPGQTDLTVAAWVKTSSTNQEQVICQRDGSSTNGQFFFYLQSGQVWFSDYQNNLGNGFTDHSTSSVADGNWHYIVFTKSGGTAGTFYVDGTANGTTTAAYNITYSSSITSAIGNDKRDNVQWFNGAIDEVAMWNRALTSSEITALYSGGAGLQYPF